LDLGDGVRDVDLLGDLHLLRLGDGIGDLLCSGDSVGNILDNGLDNGLLYKLLDKLLNHLGGAGNWDLDSFGNVLGGAGDLDLLLNSLGDDHLDGSRLYRGRLYGSLVAWGLDLNLTVGNLVGSNALSVNRTVGNWVDHSCRGMNRNRNRNRSGSGLGAENFADSDGRSARKDLTVNRLTLPETAFLLFPDLAHFIHDILHIIILKMLANILFHCYSNLLALSCAGTILLVGAVLVDVGADFSARTLGSH
jgi:hypothetical protein